MLGKSVPACYRSVGLVTEDAGPQASKSTDPRQLPDIWKLADRHARTRRHSVWRASAPVAYLATTKQRRSDDEATTPRRRRDDAATTPRRRSNDPPSPSL